MATDIPARTEHSPDGLIEISHPDAGTARVHPRQARVMAKSGWTATSSPADESAPTPTNTEE